PSADRQPVAVLLVALVQPSLLQFRSHQLLGGVSMNIVEWLVKALDVALFIENVDHRQTVSLGDFVVDCTVSRRQLENTGAEFRLYCLVGENGHSLLGE